MAATWLESSEKLNYLPLIRLGLSCDLVEIVYFVFSSVWNISFMWELRLQWIFGKLNFHTNMLPTMFIINLKELCNFTWKLQIMIIFVQRTHSIPLDRFHDEL